MKETQRNQIQFLLRTQMILNLAALVVGISLMIYLINGFENPRLGRQNYPGINFKEY